MCETVFLIPRVHTACRQGARGGGTMEQSDRWPGAPCCWHTGPSLGLSFPSCTMLGFARLIIQRSRVIAGSILGVWGNLS